MRLKVQVDVGGSLRGRFSLVPQPVRIEGFEALFLKIPLRARGHRIQAAGKEPVAARSCFLEATE